LTLLIIILAVMAVLIVLLCIPLEIEISGLFQPGPDIRIRLRYLFGLISWDLKKQGKKPEYRKPGKVQQGRKGLSISQVWELSQTEGLIVASLKLISRILHKIRSRRIEADLRVSLGDDYYTGMLFGFLIPLILYSGQQPHYDVKLQPAFEEDLLLEGSIYGSWQVIPIKALEPCFVFAFSRPAWQAGRKLISYKCTRKD